VSAELWKQFEGQSIENTYLSSEEPARQWGFGGVFLADHVVEGRIGTRERASWPSNALEDAAQIIGGRIRTAIRPAGETAGPGRQRHKQVKVVRRKCVQPYPEDVRNSFSKPNLALLCNFLMKEAHPRQFPDLSFPIRVHRVRQAKPG
jgi:hypothetical protein